MKSCKELSADGNELDDLNERAAMAIWLLGNWVDKRTRLDEAISACRSFAILAQRTFDSAKEPAIEASLSEESTGIVM